MNGNGYNNLLLTYNHGCETMKIEFWELASFSFYRRSYLVSYSSFVCLCVYVWLIKVLCICSILSYQFYDIFLPPKLTLHMKILGLMPCFCNERTQILCVDVQWLFASETRNQYWFNSYSYCEVLFSSF